MSALAQLLGTATKLSIKLAIFLPFFFSSNAAISVELADTIEKIKPSVVAVGLLRPAKGPGAKGPRHEYRGTGFVVGNGRQVITNNHVLPVKNGKDSSARLAVFSGRGQRVHASSARVVRVDASHDLALLEITGTTLKPLALGDTSVAVREGDSVAFTGFPLGMVLGLYPATNLGIVSAISPIVIPASSSTQLTAAQIRQMGNPFEIYQLDAIAYPGNSGSPMYDPKSGLVLGIINSVFVKTTKEAIIESPSAITYSIPAIHAKKLLASP